MAAFCASIISLTPALAISRSVSNSSRVNA
jgi:hypothetical protein